MATVLGIAFQLYDPEHPVETKDNVGITLALIPANRGSASAAGTFRSTLAFQTARPQGRVFIPMDMVIGGRERLGQGWSMLMQRLTVGRSISLPALPPPPRLNIVLSLTPGGFAGCASNSSCRSAASRGSRNA